MATRRLQVYSLNFLLSILLIITALTSCSDVGKVEAHLGPRQTPHPRYCCVRYLRAQPRDERASDMGQGGERRDPPGVRAPIPCW